MHFRTGLVLGLGVGYYFGAKAGRERFEQLDRVLTKVRESEAIDTAAEKARAVLDLSVERARDLIESHGEADAAERVIVTPPDPSLN